MRACYLLDFKGKKARRCPPEAYTTFTTGSGGGLVPDAFTQQAPAPDDCRSFEGDEKCSFLDSSSRHYFHAPDGPRRRGAKLVLHLHRFHDDDSLARFNYIAGADVYPDNQSRHRRQHRCRTGGRGVGRGKITNRTRSLVERFDIESISVDPENVLATALFFLRHDAVDPGAEFDPPNRAVLDIRELGVRPSFPLVRDTARLDRD